MRQDKKTVICSYNDVTSETKNLLTGFTLDLHYQDLH